VTTGHGEQPPPSLMHVLEQPEEFAAPGVAPPGGEAALEGLLDAPDVVAAASTLVQEAAGVVDRAVAVVERADQAASVEQAEAQAEAQAEVVAARQRSEIVAEPPLPTPLPRALAPWSVQWRLTKRLMDIVGASVLLLLFLPAFAVVGVLVLLDSPGPMFFRQRRAGWRGEDFLMVKFRSMVQGAERLVIDLTDHNESDGLLFKVRDDPRVTRVGRVIRRLSVDELPQLVNVLMGDMSLVGPRPLPVSSEAFGGVDRQRLDVRPGITGPWQVSGRSDVGYELMIELDLDYIGSASLRTDLSILVRTLPAVLKCQGAC
jgi:lipopolysaccharide/colanic/teichoic acid biosynthesis glycosyltransferase